MDEDNFSIIIDPKSNNSIGIIEEPNKGVIKGLLKKQEKKICQKIKIIINVSL